MRRRVCGGHGDAHADSPEALGRPEGGALGTVFEGRRGASGPKKRYEKAEHERSIRVSGLGLYFCCLFGRFLDPVVLSFCSSISSPGAVAKDAVQLAPTMALKSGARSTPHTAPQPLPAVDLVAEAAKLREAMARGAQAAQQAQALGNWGDAVQSGAEAAAPADAVGGAAGAA